MTRAKFFLILSILAFGCLLVSQAVEAKGQLSEHERYVLQQVAKGEWADLKEQFGEKEDDRKLSARFLEDLLTGELKVKVHRKGIWIFNAVITEPLDLGFAHIPHSTYLFYCLFKEKVSCLDAVFEKHFMNIDSKLEKEGIFHQIKVKSNFFCRVTSFQGPVNFVAADIGGQFSADGAKFLSQGGTATFEGMRVGQVAFFRNVTFKSDVELSWGTYLDLRLSGIEEDKQEGPENITRLSLIGTEVKGN
jgi:hypothetical protein